MATITPQSVTPPQSAPLQSLSRAGGFDAPQSLGRIWLVAQMTFREAVRKRMVWAVVLLTAVFVAFFGWGVVRFQETWDARTARVGRIPLSYTQAVDLNVAFGVFIIFFLAAVMGIFASIGTIAGEIDGGTFQAILPKPIRRWEVVLGKWAGFALMIALYVIVTTSAVGGIVYAITRHLPPNIVQSTLVNIVAAWWLLSLTVLGSTIFATMANGIVVYMLYAFGLACTILESIGTLLGIEGMQTAGLVGSIILPSQRIYNYANYLIQPSTNITFGGGGGIGGSPPSGVIVPFALGYLAVLLALACFNFRKKDL